MTGPVLPWLAGAAFVALLVLVLARLAVGGRAAHRLDAAAGTASVLLVALLALRFATALS